MVATALALVLMVGWLGTVWLQSSQMQVLGALLLPAAGAAPALRDLPGAWEWRRPTVRWISALPSICPPCPRARTAPGPPAWSESDVLELASRLGIKGELQRYSAKTCVFPLLISSIDLNRGMFFFEGCGEGQPGAAVPEEMEEAAVRWLSRRACCPDNHTPSNRSTTTTVSIG